ncbi:hypothetical protein [Sporosarcina sp. YIM B06819]|uniref:hypothetical protein n=1 Tax=Sporosarcina sp. YIM B06819 TaxID=3081769 RepID=UPI00298C7769|nr:hypothetical protein [Sporosarcina sp. YIM B06819]
MMEMLVLIYIPMIVRRVADARMMRVEGLQTLANFAIPVKTCDNKKKDEVG